MVSMMRRLHFVRPCASIQRTPRNRRPACAFVPKFHRLIRVRGAPSRRSGGAVGAIATHIDDDRPDESKANGATPLRNTEEIFVGFPRRGGAHQSTLVSITDDWVPFNRAVCLGEFFFVARPSLPGNRVGRMSGVLSA